MKKFTLILFIVLVFSSVIVNADENDNPANKGSIAGRIVDADHLPLPGATVFIESLKKGTVSDVDGFYRLTSLNAGDYKVTVSYIGFQKLSKQVSVKLRKTTEVNFEMKAGINIGEIVVNGALQGQSKALNQQKNSMNITNVISSDQVGRFPDANIGDALKRIPGINVQYDQGEARFGNIRGTAPEFNSVTINGDRMPSAEAEIRSNQLDLVPADMIQSIEVNKVVTPDMDADAIGGSVNLVTKSSPYKRRISGTVGGGYNFLSEKPAESLSLMYGNRFLNNKLGMVLSGSYQNVKLGSDNIEAEWEQDDNGNPYTSDFQVRTYYLQRMRKSLSASFDYKINANHKLDFKGIYNHRNDWENRYRLRFKDVEENDGQWVTEIRRQTKGGLNDNKNARLEDQRAMNFSLGGDHHFGAVKMEWKGSYAKASEERPNERYISYRHKDVVINPDLSDTEKPFMNILTSTANDLNSEWDLNEMTEEFQYTDDIDKHFKVDLSFPWLHGDYANKFKIGFRYKGKDKKRVNEFYEYEPTDEDGFDAKAYANIESQTKDNFLAGDQYKAGSFVTKVYLSNLDLNSSSYEKTEVIEELAGNFNAKENVHATYLRFDQKIGDNFDMIAGLRMEATSLEYTGRELFFDEEGDESLKVTQTEEDNYINLLPSLIGKYSFSENTKLKFAWTNTISRPRYYDLVPHVEINLEDMEAEIGNPELEPTKSMNFDLIVEHYFNTIGQVSAGVFYKDITDFVITQELRDYSYVGNTYDKFKKPFNAGDADLFGFELSFQRQFDFLPGFLKQTGFYANYTYNHSKTKNFNLEGRDAEAMPLPGTPENTLNASMYYEGQKLTIRASFNFADDFIDEVGDEAFYDRYYDKVSYLDLNANYSINKKINIFFEAHNLLNQPLRYFQGTSDYTMQEEYYNTKVSFGVKFDF